MDTATCRRLVALNRCFYHRHAAAFAATRQAPWPGWKRLVDHLNGRAGEEPLRVLDIGCGNGRFGSFLAATVGRPLCYTGLDGSSTMLELARRMLANMAQVTLLRRGFICNGGLPMPAGPFHLVVVFGVLHHLPGARMRRQLVEDAALRLAPGGMMALTVWRLGSQARFAERVVPWDELNRRLRRPLNLAQLEEGDMLLSFGSGPSALRYCHAVSDREIASWLAILPPLRDDYFADGASGDLNRYLVCGSNA